MDENLVHKVSITLFMLILGHLDDLDMFGMTFI